MTLTKVGYLGLLVYKVHLCAAITNVLLSVRCHLLSSIVSCGSVA